MRLVSLGTLDLESRERWVNSLVKGPQPLAGSYRIGPGYLVRLVMQGEFISPKQDERFWEVRVGGGATEPLVS